MNRLLNKEKYSFMKIKTFIISLISLMIITACEKMIDVDQPDIIEQEQAFSDQNSVRLSMIGIYGLMSDLVEPLFLAGEVRADLVVANKSAESDIKEFSNNSFSASNPYVSPKPFYNIINNTNDFIHEFEGLVESEKMLTSDFIKYKSELVAIRVWCQYQIAKIYGTCSYYTEESDSGSINIQQQYSYEDTSFIRILINDLTYSDTNIFTATTDPVIWQTIRMSDFYVNELLAELYIEVGDYQNALDKLNEVTIFGDRDNLSSTRFSINTPYSPGFLWLYDMFLFDWESSDLTDNAVFMIAFDNKYNQTNELWNWTLSLNYQVAPASWFRQQFYEHAFEDEENPDYRYYTVRNIMDYGTKDQYVIMKYTENDRPFIMTRTARISLLKAYCSLLKYKETNAKVDINNVIKEIDNVRKRVGVNTIDKDKMPEDEIEQIEWLEDLIVDEMAYELCFEGQRWFDLMRIANQRNDPSYLADKVAQKYPEDSREEIRAKLLNKENWFIPIFE